MTLAPTDYDYGDAANYSFATEITCANDEARAMFVEAFGHMLNYNHEQAIACFSKVTELDDTCAMAWWGIAYCVSSNYNWAPGLGSGHDSIQQAVSLKDGCTELEQDLIDALATRHSAHGQLPRTQRGFRRSNGASVREVQRKLGCHGNLRRGSHEPESMATVGQEHRYR